MKSRVLLGLCLSLLLAGSSSADTRFFGSVDNLWSNPDNWNNGLPDADDKVQVEGGALCILDYDAGAIKHTALEGGGATHLRLVDGAVLNVNDWTIIGYAGVPEEPHLLEVLGGVYNANARLFVGFLGSGKLVIDYTGVVNLNAQQLGIGENTDGQGRVEIRGGALNLLSDSGLPLRFRAGANSTASMDFSGGVMTQAYSDARLAVVNDHIADGTITAYDGAGTMVVETVEGTLIVKGLHPLNPAPADSSIAVPGSITLQWTVDAGTLVDVWIGTQADLSDFEKVVDKKAATSVQVDTVKGTRYFWAVDTYAPGTEEPTWGPIFDFYADNLAPVVDAGDDVTTWVVDGSVDVALAGAVIDADPTTTTWTVVSQPDDPNSADAAIADPAAPDTNITLSALGEYVLELQADDGEYQGTDTVTINVYSDGCAAAQSLPDYVPLVGDLDQDCDVDQDDMDLLLENWLECVALGGCDPNNPDAL
ncbi:MAG: hypothetical protein JSW27_00875 [Phycisphaerales bacterium]|nr:MAG: hypothetical protein JSW27_00875 [Phycisphaerales bacterium]